MEIFLALGVGVAFGFTFGMIVRGRQAAKVEDRLAGSVMELESKVARRNSEIAQLNGMIEELKAELEDCRGMASPGVTD